MPSPPRSRPTNGNAAAGRGLDERVLGRDGHEQLAVAVDVAVGVDRTSMAAWIDLLVAGRSSVPTLGRRRTPAGRCRRPPARRGSRSIRRFA